MPLADATAALLVALQGAVPDAPVRPTRDGPVLTPMAVSVERTSPQVVRLGARGENVIHPINCIIQSHTGDVSVTETTYNAVYDAVLTFFEAVRETAPGEMDIHWPTGVAIDIQTDGGDVTGIVTVPLVERYPAGFP